MLSVPGAQLRIGNPPDVRSGLDDRPSADRELLLLACRKDVAGEEARGRCEVLVVQAAQVRREDCDLLELPGRGRNRGAGAGKGDHGT